MSLPDKPIPQEDQDPLSQTRWPKQTVWHYTDAAGFAGIVEHNVLRASATAFMNDHQELRTGADLFKDLVDRHLSFVDPSVQVEFQRLVQHGLRNDRYRTYIACASAMSDSLTMWRNYTGEAGFAVALDARVPLRMRRQRLSMSTRTRSRLTA